MLSFHSGLHSWFMDFMSPPPSKNPTPSCCPGQQAQPQQTQQQQEQEAASPQQQQELEQEQEAQVSWNAPIG